jgi:superfamily II DNA or RNA helicase
MITPYPDQIQFVNNIIRKLLDGYTRICCQLATGGGKTVCFAYLITRYLTKTPSAKICILVHREELLQQTKKTLATFKVHNVDVQMVETFNNKLKKQPNIHYDLMIIDECHLANFFKVIDHYKDKETIVLGFSATPKSASKKTPLKGYFQTIVVGTEINKLIAMKRLCPAIHHTPETSIDKKAIKVTGGEYNLASMAVEFSKPKLVEAVVDAYRKFCDGKKTLIFNTTIEHSNLVNECFRNAGFASRSLDSKTATDEIRKETFKWLAETPCAILNNVGIATTGFDDPTIEAIIFNRKTKSLPLWLQCCGRGARVSANKDYFIIIDLGENIEGEKFGHWNERHDWEGYFFNPDKSSDGVAPMKLCPECEARIYMSSTECRWCGHLMPRKTVYTDMVLTLRILPDSPIKRNSHDALTKAIEFTAQRIKSQLLTINEKKELMFYSFKEIYERAAFDPKPHILSHLVSVYGK